MTAPKHPRKNRGFAMLLALAMLGLVAMLLIFLAHYFAWENKRTRSINADAQLNQLLLAGAHDAWAKAKTWQGAPPTEPWKLDLPKALAEDHATVSLASHSDSAENVTVTVDAHYDNQQASQTLHLQHGTGGWGLKSAELAGAD